MKKFIGVTLFLAVATLTIHAQQTPDKIGEKSRNRQHGERFRDLHLTDDQKTKFKTANDEFRKQMEELRKKDDITVKEWRTRMETLRKDHHEKMQGLLTSEQKATLQKAREDRKALRQVDREARAQRMKIRLKLTDEQATRMKTSRTELESKMKAIRENKSLSDDQRREQMRQLREKQHENLKSILSEEQLKQLHQRHNHSHRREVV